MAHARLSASESKRWINCAGSVQAAARHPKGRSSRAAREGTAAHFLADHCLSGRLRNSADWTACKIAIYGEEDDACWLKDLPDGEAATEIFTVDGEMVQGVDVYLDACWERIDECERDDIPYELYLEQWFDLTDIHPHLGGTGDFVLAQAFGWVHVIDLKFGKGVMVEVLDNTQLKIYALGALKMNPDAEGVKLTIVQPRKTHEDGPVRSVDFTAAELREFEAELREAAYNTERPNAPLRAGDWCTFCPAIHDCEEVTRIAQEEAGADFDDEPFELDASAAYEDGGRMQRIIKWAPVLDRFIKSVLSYEQRELEAGRPGPIPGRKLVNKRSRGRKWAVDDDAVVRAVAKRAKLKKAALYEPAKLLSPAKMEKLSKAVKDVIKDKELGLTHSPPGGLTVADEDDPRPAVDPASAAKMDFEDDEEGGDE